MTAVISSTSRVMWRSVRVLSNSSNNSSDSSTISIDAFAVPKELDSISYLYHLAQTNVLVIEVNEVTDAPDGKFRGSVAVQYHHLRITGSALRDNKREAKRGAVDRLFMKLQSLSADEWWERGERLSPTIPHVRESQPPSPLSTLEDFASSPGMSKMRAMIASIRLKTSKIAGLQQVLEVGLVWGSCYTAWAKGPEIAEQVCARHYILEEHYERATIAQTKEAANFKGRHAEVIPRKSLEAALSADLGDGTILDSPTLLVITSIDVRRLAKLGVDVAQLLPQLQVCDVAQAMVLGKEEYGEGELMEAILRNVDRNDGGLLEEGRNVVDSAYNGREICMAMMEELNKEQAG